MKKKVLTAGLTMMLALSVLGGNAFAMPDDSQWYWLSSDNKYSKYYGNNSIKVDRAFGNIAVSIRAVTRTDYAPEGAEETLKNYGIADVSSSQLKYSLAEVEINPQNRTFAYISETFYDENDKVLWQKKYSPLRPKEINSQEFDEEFYTNIVDKVFGAGEEDRRKADNRWLTNWEAPNGDGTTTKSMADTTTMRIKGDNLIFWEWKEIKNSDGKVQEIRFQKKVVNLAQETAKINRCQKWDAVHGWKDITKDIDGRYYPIDKTSGEYNGFKELQGYVAQNMSWVKRYSLD